MPELEILMIINEGLYAKFLKSREKPKDFAKSNIVYNGYRYNQTGAFLEMYYGGKRIKLLIQNLKEYKRLKRHKQGELYVADLLR